MQQANAVTTEVGSDQLIVNAAIDLIMEGGFSAMSMRSLARKAGMQAGSLYYHFPSKIDVLEEVLDSLLQQRLNDWLSIKPKRASALTQLDAFISFHVGRVLRNSREEDLVMLELKNLKGPQRATVVAQDELYCKELIAIIKRGVSTGIFNVSDVDIAARALMGLLAGGATFIADSESFAVQKLTELSRRLLGIQNSQRLNK
ncbi:TetR/AcrR family transcriptional regulator [Pseudomonas moorei]|uniref:TetR/AcrR family transcriptional regulator n=1 Tax=Pseudomonas moorei TaxID=395599 RepID=UPI001FF1D88C|nr:TetR/AcrR family transcriptional regulator [Pseudomonas moorei]